MLSISPFCPFRKDISLNSLEHSLIPFSWCFVVNIVDIDPVVFKVSAMYLNYYIITWITPWNWRVHLFMDTWYPLTKDDLYQGKIWIKLATLHTVHYLFLPFRFYLSLHWNGPSFEIELNPRMLLAHLVEMCRVALEKKMKRLQTNGRRLTTGAQNSSLESSAQVN